MSDHEPDDLLERARESYEPSEAARQRMKSKIDAAIAAAAVASAAATAAPHAGGSAAAGTSGVLLGAGAKIAAGTLLCATLIAASVWFSRPLDVTAPPATTTEPVIADPVVAEPVIAEPAVVDPVVADPVIAELTPAEETSAPAPRRPAARIPEPETITPVIEPEPIVDSLAIELGLIDDARAAIARHDYAAAGRALDTHARDFPAGALRDERDVSRIVVLCATGRDDDARARAAALEGRTLSPGARADLRASCVGE